MSSYEQNSTSTKGGSPASLTVQTAISLLSSQQLEDICREVEKHKYYYLLVVESMEDFNKYDLRHLKSFYAHSAEEILEFLSKEDRLIKLMCGDDQFKNIFYNYVGIDPFGVVRSSFNGFSLSSDVQNAKQIAAYVRENLDHAILLNQIADFTYEDIYLYDNEFNLLRVNDLTHSVNFSSSQRGNESLDHGYDIVLANVEPHLYSY
jgi:hypothetical protein